MDPAAEEATALPSLLERLADTQDSRTPAVQITRALEQMVLHPDYPCLGARSVFNRERATIVVLERLASAESTRALLDALTAFGRETDRSEGFASLVAVFRATDIEDEEQFESLLWSQLERLHEADRQPWDHRVSDDPADPHFAFSVGGTAFFVVGLHPHASRVARRAPLPTLVFNLHEQFEELRESERFARMRDTIRRRDTELQGSTNPMVDDHGSSSEARQYSGRVTPPDWTPPVTFDQETA